jgi:SAM-dependent methyltransferase
MTNPDTTSPPKYEFAEKYDPEHAKKYFEKHNTRLLAPPVHLARSRHGAQGAGTWPDVPSVLDLPCGTGRFWEMLAEEPERKIYVADNSQNMIDTGMAMRPKRSRRAHREILPVLRLRHRPGGQLRRVRVQHPPDAPHREERRPRDDAQGVRPHQFRHRDRLPLGGRQLQAPGATGSTRSARREPAARTSRATASSSRNARSRPTFSAAGLKLVGHVDFVKYWDKWRAYVLRVKSKPCKDEGFRQRTLAPHPRPQRPHGLRRALGPQGRLVRGAQPPPRRLERRVALRARIAGRRQVRHLPQAAGEPQGALFLAPPGARRMPTFLREFRTSCTTALQGVPTLEPVYFAHAQGGKDYRAILVTEELTGFVALEDRVQPLAEPRRAAAQGASCGAPQGRRRPAAHMHATASSTTASSPSMCSPA